MRNSEGQGNGQENRRKICYQACCSHCGTHLHGITGDSCNVVTRCPGCGKNMVVMLKKNRLIIFEDRRKNSLPLPSGVPDRRVAQAV